MPTSRSVGLIWPSELPEENRAKFKMMTDVGARFYRCKCGRDQIMTAMADIITACATGQPFTI